MEISQKRVELLYDPDPEIPLYFFLPNPKDTEVFFQKDTCTPLFIAAFSAIARIWNQPMCPKADER